MGIKPLQDWHRKLDKNWIYVHNYFYTRITTGISEAFNNVIKTVGASFFSVEIAA